MRRPILSIISLFYFLINFDYLHGIPVTADNYYRNPHVAETQSQRSHDKCGFSKISSKYLNHKNFYLLPSIESCGNPIKEKPPAVSIGNNIAGKYRVKRVIGGKPSKIGAFPWMVQILRLNIDSGEFVFRCGASLISSRYVLTAAHCTSSISAGSALTHVMIGSFENFDRMNNKPKVGNKSTSYKYDNNSITVAKLVEIDEIFAHENYTTGNTNNDISLIRLKYDVMKPFEDVTENDILHWTPICLPPSPQILEDMEDGNDNLELSGWGRMDTHFDWTKQVLPRVLKYVSLKLMPRSYCNEFFSTNNGNLTETKLCLLGGIDSGACHGDSGSPLSKGFPNYCFSGASMDKESDLKFFQFGLTSYGSLEYYQCGAQGVPVVFTNVVEYMPWILDNLKP